MKPRRPCVTCGKLRKENERLREEVARLKELLEQSRRSGKRQAAPFSKGEPKRKPRRPGRKPGADYGRRGHRKPPDHVDETIEVPLPSNCPECGGSLEPKRVADQYQADIPPVRPRVTHFKVAIGSCCRCKKRVQGRHPKQTSDALGAAASQVGPNALALATDIRNRGVPMRNVTSLLDVGFSLSLTAGGLCQALQRMARRTRPTYDLLVEHVSQAPIVSPDETGWRVGGLSRWLWVFVTEDVAVYSIAAGRGFEQAAAILGEDYAGTLECDGWSAYTCFENARRQSCLNHLTRRTHELLETAKRGAARVGNAVMRILKGALKLRDRRDAKELSAHGVAVLRGRLEKKLERLLEWNPTDEDNRKLLKHLRREHEAGAIFLFLEDPAVQATNWRAEQAIRPAVVMRKICGGNRSERGAFTHETLTTVLVSTRKLGLDPLKLLPDLLRAPPGSVIPAVQQRLITIEADREPALVPS